MTKPIRKIRTKHEEVILVCRKCSKKIGGGFGPNGDLRFDKAMRHELGLGKGRKAASGSCAFPASTSVRRTR